MIQVQDIKKSVRFYKGERLKKKKLIEKLFSGGIQTKCYPLLLFVQNYEPEEFPFHQVLFSVPKKHFKKAVDRNTIRRRMKEGYRLHKHMLYNIPEGLPFLLGYVYISKTILSYQDIETGIKASISYLVDQKKRQNNVAES